MSDESTTQNLLTNIVLKNVSLTAMVLRSANSVHYNPGGKPTLSVSRALTLMGWDSVRSLSAAVLLFEHFCQQPERLKELVLLMLLTGNHARQIALRSGMRAIEEAYLCGMFRNLGELAVACHRPDQYAAIQKMMAHGRKTAPEACECLLHFKYEDLGKAMARAWNLPDTVASSMDRPPLSALPVCDRDRLQVISSFSHGLSLAVYGHSLAESQGALAALLRQYETALPLRRNEIPAILDAAYFETEDTFRAARLPIDRAGLSKQILAATGAGLPSEAAGVPPLGRVAPPGPAPSDVLATLLKELGATLDSGEDFDLTALILLILEAIYRGVGLDRALFCLLNGDRTQVQARLGVGTGAEQLVDRFRFPVSIRTGPLASALLGKEDVFVDAASTVRYSCPIFTNVTRAPHFGIVPLIVEGIVAGCLYFDSAAEGFILDARKRQALLELRRFAVTAITRKRR